MKEDRFGFGGDFPDDETDDPLFGEPDDGEPIENDPYPSDFFGEYSGEYPEDDEIPEEEIEDDFSEESDEPEDELSEESDEPEEDEPSEEEPEEGLSDEEPEDELPEEADEEPSEEDEEPEEEPEEKTPAISSDLIRGHINTIILRSLYDGDKYGYEIIAEIERKSHNQYSLKQPSLYSALKRLEKEGYITSYWGGSVTGGRRKYFSLTDEGKRISELNQSEWEYSRTVIDSLISDKDFDFGNPAPVAVDMRILTKSTSRMPEREEDEENAEEQSAFEEERARYEERLREREEVLRAREEAGTRREQELLEREFALREEEERIGQAREALREAEAQRTDAMPSPEPREEAETEEPIEGPVEELSEGPMEEPIEEPIEEPAEEPIEELAAEPSEEERTREEEIRRAQAQELLLKKEEQNARIIEMEPFAEERARYEQMLRDQEAELNARRERELAEQAARIREEDEARFRERERQMIHENYLALINGSRREEPAESGYYYEEPSDEPSYIYVSKPENEREYRSIIRKLYESALPEEPAAEPASAPAPVTASAEEVPPAPAAEPAPVSSPAEEAPRAAKPARRNARSLDGVDFYDLEARAAQDGIRICVSGGKRKNTEERSESLVHKGKALFLSAIVVFLLCLAEGSIALGFQKQLSLPRFYPFFIWGTGLALLLVTGLLFLNRFGERAIRKTGNLLVNVIVSYALCVIVILIVALARQIDFTNMGRLATYVIFPVVYFFSIVVFGTAYYMQIRPTRGA